MTWSDSYIPEDNDQQVVQTPYGRGVVIRTRRETTSATVVRQVELTDWTKGSTTNGTFSRNQKPPPTLFTCLDYPTVPPQVGDDVVCLFGRGRVMDLRSQNNSVVVVVVRLSSWRLAGRSRVTCMLNIASVAVVRPKRVYEMTVYERVEHAQLLKAQAATFFAAKRYDEALETYARAVDAVRYVQHKTDSSNEVRADLVVVMVTCSNNAATCCLQLHKWDEAAQLARDAMLLIDALEEKRGKKIHSLLNKEGTNDVKLFGEWRVKSLIVLARSAKEKNENDAAMELLSKARSVIETYTGAAFDRPENKSSTRNLLSNDKEIRKLYVLCRERRKEEKKLEKKRAQKMFAAKGDNEEKKEITEFTESPLTSPHGLPSIATTNTSYKVFPTESKNAFPSPPASSLKRRSSANSKSSLEKKRVSFSEHVHQQVYEPQEQYDGPTLSYQVYLAAMGLALGVGITFASLHWAMSRQRR